MNECSILGCTDPIKARGWCRRHYLRWWFHGDPAIILTNHGKSSEERFLLKVTKLENGCWEWTGGLNAKGYGLFLDGKTVAAHRWAYERWKGPLPANEPLDHLCRFRRCVNPAHLELVTWQENALRGFGPTAINARKTHCNEGHEFTPKNTYIYRGGRQCRKCHHARNVEYRARRRASAI